MENVKPRIIAFYLPQFYPTPENDKWWGKGFTEWTNVGKAKPLFKGHFQPRVPADLGYYDLRIPEVRVQQAELAKEAGIEGFCYWHYWFAGRRLLDKVFSEVVQSGTPDFPFCLCWANHSWYQKTWDSDRPNKLLIEQTYPGKQDFIDHFNAMLPAFKDERYMKVDGKLIFGIFAPWDFPDYKLFIDTWNELAKKNGLSGFYFWGYSLTKNQYQNYLSQGFNGIVFENILTPEKHSILKKIFIETKRRILRIPHLTEYDEYAKTVIKTYEVSEHIHPCIDPNFDHSPRSGKRGTILINSTPEKWGNLCSKIFERVSVRTSENNLVFIKAWNEWGEGNYLEPDLQYGKQYLEELKKAIDKLG